MNNDAVGLCDEKVPATQKKKGAEKGGDRDGGL